MKYISLKNGVVFRTSQNYTWFSSSRRGRSLVEMVKDGQETISVGGEICFRENVFVPCTDFQCDPDDIQATWNG